MIFDDLWRAEWRAARAHKRIRDKYDPLIEAAQKEKNERDYHSAVSEMMFELDLNDEPELIRTERLLRRARRLGIPVPPKPAFDSPERDNDQNWVFNQSNGNWFLSDAKELELRQQVRKEEADSFDHRWRYVTRVIVPISGLIIGILGMIMGFLSLIHSLRAR